ncbi:DUF4397 domain-containing protein [Haladaptatus sp. DYSN1]|uniref:DUF4397 domain-containing protein n=1 Tax=unclassified Haladaptatus TaxID=2622732 RepID=UPI002406D5FB|nr:DUF4397 domain-containing protein [Haladaptatus sp. DYSN1]
MLQTTYRAVLAVLLALTVIGSVATIGGAFAQEEPTAGDEIPTQERTYLRVIHASPDAPSVDVYVENESVLENVSFSTVSDYLTLAAGSYNVTITAAGDREAEVFNGTLTLDARSINTVIATGEVSALGTNESTAFAPKVFEDDAYTPAENESALSVIHLSPDAPAVDVTTTVNNTTIVLADNVSFGNGTEYLTVPAGNYTVDIRAASDDNNGTVVTSVDVTLESGVAYSALAVGYLDPDSATGDAPFEVLLIEDATVTVVLPGEEPSDDDGEGPEDPDSPAS